MSFQEEMLPQSLAGLRVAIVHYWFVGRAGGERVVEELANLFPSADLFALVADPSEMAESLRTHRLTTSFLQSIPAVAKFHRHTLALQPLALEQFDLSQYDLVLSSESGPAKGVITGPQTLHVCYCHSPMRYIWDLYPTYLAAMKVPSRWVFRFVAHRMRLWDLASAARVDRFVANSRFVASRIRKVYRRDAEVIHPPVQVRGSLVADQPGSFYLCAGRLVDYKRVDLAIDVCSRSHRRLKIVGEGPALAQLRSRAGKCVEFLGRVSDDEMRRLMHGCRALLFPGEEDFGIVPIEVMAHGRPVIAYASGGALETIAGIVEADKFHTGCTGIFFEKQTMDSLDAAITTFESVEALFVADKIYEHALTFDSAVFRRKIVDFLSSAAQAFWKDGAAEEDLPGVVASETGSRQ